jgi:hypothetical protein
MAGGSLANIPVIADGGFVTAASVMKPVDSSSKGQYTLADAGKGSIVYSNTPDNIQIDLTNAAGTFRVKWFDPNTGSVLGKEEKVKGGKTVTLKNAKKGSVVVWIRK